MILMSMSEYKMLLKYVPESWKSCLRVLNFKIFWKSMSTDPIEGRVAINNPELQEIQREYYYLEHPPSSSTHEEPKVSSVVIDYNMIIFIHCAASCIHLKCSNIRNISWIQWCIFHSTEHVHIWSICNMLPGKCQDQIICINYSTQFQLQPLLTTRSRIDIYIWLIIHRWMVLFTHTDWLPWKWWETNLVSAQSQMLLLACAYWLVRKGLAINHLQTAENEKTRTKSFLNLRLFLGLYTEIK